MLFKGETPPVDWLQCCGCNIWYHTYCAKYNQLYMSLDPYDKFTLSEVQLTNLMNRRENIDKNIDFYCEVCELTKKMISGDGGAILKKFYEETLDSLSR